MMNKISDLSGASFCEGVEAAHSSHSQQAAIAKALGITKDSVRMDSQAKYSSIARGDGDVYLRLPTSATYQEKIWVCVTLFVVKAVLILAGSCGGEVTSRRSRGYSLRCQWKAAGL